MVQINTIFVVHRTSRSIPNAGTDAAFQLQIVRPTDARGTHVTTIFKDDFPDLPYDEREPGRTDSYQFDVSEYGVRDTDWMYMEMIRSTDGWRPTSLFVIGILPDGLSGRLLGSHPHWDKWFDRNEPGYQPRHRISALGPAA